MTVQLSQSSLTFVLSSSTVSTHATAGRLLCCHKISCHRTTKATKEQPMLHRNKWSLCVLLECITAVHALQIVTTQQ